MIYICIMKRETQLLIRLTESEKESFERAAEIAGIGITAWVRERLRSAAILDLQNVGEKIAFLKPIKLKKTDEGK